LSVHWTEWEKRLPRLPIKKYKAWLKSGHWVTTIRQKINLRQITTILIFKLATASVCIGQDFKKDFVDGLYQPSPDGIIVYQLKSDTLQSFKLTESKFHFERVTKILFDSIPKRRFFELGKNNQKRIRIADVLKIRKGKHSVILSSDSLFNVFSFIKRDVGYEMYFSKYKVKKEELANTIRRDTTDSFKFHIFNLNDLEKLKKLKNFNDVTENEFNELMNSIESHKTMCLQQLKNNQTEYGRLEEHEILIKALLEKKYNPLVRPKDFDKILKKHRPTG
jgi:hypothetical protein